MKSIPTNQLMQADEDRDLSSKEGTAPGSSESAKKVPKVKRKYTVVSNE